MSGHQTATIADTVYFWFGANNTSGSGGDGATALYDVREAGAAVDAIPLLSGSPSLLSHANYPAGCYEIAVAATTGNGFAADDTFGVFCTLAIDSQNPTGFVGSCTLTPLAKTSELEKVPKSDGSSTWNSTALAAIQSEANDALVSQKLDHLVAVADADDPVNDSILAKMASADGDWSNFDKTSDALEAIANSVSAASDLPFNPDSSGTVVGTEGGTYADAASDNATYWSATDVGVASSIEAIMQLGSNRTATQVYINGHFDAGASRVAYIYAYNWTTASYVLLGSGSSETEMRNSASDNDYVFPLGPQYTKPSATIGEVRIKVTAQTQNNTDVINLDLIELTGASNGAVSPIAVAIAVHDELEEHFDHIPLYPGNIHYVTTGGNDANSGHVPTLSLLTIGAAITLSSAGDMIVVKAGTYDASIELPAGKDGLELILEKGVLITDSGTSTQTVLVTGNNCVIRGGQFTQAGQIGIKVTGNNCILEDIISGLSNTIGFDIDGIGCRLERCFSATPTVEGFNFGGGQIKAYGCETIGDAATIGFNLSGGDYGIIKDCNSNGHTTSGWTIAAGVDDVMIVDSTTGPTDGAVSDGGTNISWRNFKDNESVWDELVTGSSHHIATSAGRRLYELSSDILLTGTSPGTNSSIYINLDSDASDVDGSYDPSVISIAAGTGAGQSRQIWEYNGTLERAYVNRDWKITPDATSEYIITADSGDTHVNEGLAQGGGASTITLNSLASSDNDAYNNQIVFLSAGVGADQAKVITSYNGTSKVATVDSAWTTQPTSASIYAVLPMQSPAPSVAADILVDTNSLNDTKIPDVLSLAAINAEVDTALNTAIPGSPTAASINDYMRRVKYATCNRWDIVEASGNFEVFTDADVSFATVSAAFTTLAGVTLRKKLL